MGRLPQGIRVHLVTPNFDASEHYTLETDDPGSFAYTFSYGTAAFFVMDTRTMRVRKSRRDRTMLGEGQWQALKDWLLAVRDVCEVKFLVTSCALLFSMWLNICRDRWSGFTKERDHLLSLLATEGIEEVYLLAGDLHSAHAVHVAYGEDAHPYVCFEVRGLNGKIIECVRAGA
ncbi:MAG: alkaline phosphatase D family protein [Chloroflexota bacterium]